METDTYSLYMMIFFNTGKFLFALCAANVT